MTAPDSKKESRTMAQERTNAGKLGSWQRLNVTVQANSADLPQLEAQRLRLETLIGQGLDLTKEQLAFRASKQDKAQQFQAVMDEGTRLATFLRAAVTQHYGHTSEKLAEFGLQPFRGRKAKPAPEPAPAPVPPTPHAPPTGSGG
jgi:hypothetical protein